MDEYQDLLNRLEQGEVGNMLLNSPEWTLVKSIAQGIADVSLRQIGKIDPIKDPTAIIRLQIKAELYGDFAQNLAESMYREGNEAFKLAKELGLDKYLFAANPSETD
jgi:hypothetical protein